MSRARTGREGTGNGVPAKLSHPPDTFVDMETFTFALVLSVAVVVAAGFGLGWRRARRHRPPVPADDLLERVVSVAGKAFETHLQTGKAHLEHQRQAIDQTWGGVAARVNEELAGIKRLVTDLQKERAAQYEGLTQNLHNAAQQQQLLLDSTRKLNDVLTNTQARGQWGERMTVDILRAAGMIEGVNYLKQETTIAGSRPDFTFLLPDGQVLHMDVKFPLEAYARYLEARSDFERKKALKDFGTAVKGHVKDIASRGAYKESVTTVGYMLMFIANDAVYAFIHEHHRDVFDEALDRRVVLCSPSTLFAMLSLVRQAMDTIALERSSQEILDLLSCFSDQWNRYVEKFDLVERHLGRLNTAFEELSTTRRHQLERPLERIEEIKNRSGQESLMVATAAEPDLTLIRSD